MISKNNVKRTFLFFALSRLYPNYYRARWYDTEQGRFISQDPIGFSGGRNFYEYASNNPIKRFDPLGLDDADREWEERFNPSTPAPNPWYWSHNESADNFDKKDGRSFKEFACDIDGYNPWLTGEFGGSLQFGPLGGGDSIVVAFNPLTQEMCFYTKIVSGMGSSTGILATAGAQFGLSFGSSEGSSSGGATAEIFGDASAFGGGSGSISVLGGLGAGIGVGPTIGGGAAAGLRIGEMNLLFCINKNKCECRK